MGSTYARGFTIIETILFLAITGVLVVSILVGTGTSINIQRYRDSVISLQSILQDQYSEVINVRNEVPSGSVTCDSDAEVTIDPNAPASARGQGECVVLGRYIATVNSSTLSMSTVVGYISPTTILNSNDLESLKLYEMNTIQSSSEEYTIEWGSSLHRAGGDSPLSFSLLILRSPSSGIVRTFINPEESLPSSSIGGLVDTTYLNQTLKACVDAGGLFGANKMAVSIVEGATSSTGVEVVGDGSSEC